MATIVCTNGFYYGDQLIAFYKKNAIKVDAKGGKHTLLPLVENKIAGEGLGFQVSDFTWIGKKWALQMTKVVNHKLNTSKMLDVDIKFLESLPDAK